MFHQGRCPSTQNIKLLLKMAWRFEVERSLQNYIAVMPTSMYSYMQTKILSLFPVKYLAQAVGTALKYELRIM